MLAIQIQIGNQSFTATLADTAAARGFAEKLPLTVTMGDLNGNEKYCYMDEPLTTSPSRIGRIQAGDLMLFGSDCLVLFYKSITSGYSYTHLGQIDHPAHLSAALGRGNVRVSFNKASHKN